MRLNNILSFDITPVYLWFKPVLTINKPLDNSPFYATIWHATIWHTYNHWQWICEGQSLFCTLFGDPKSVTAKNTIHMT